MFGCDACPVLELIDGVFFLRSGFFSVSEALDRSPKGKRRARKNYKRSLRYAKFLVGC